MATSPLEGKLEGLLPISTEKLFNNINLKWSKSRKVINFLKFQHFIKSPLFACLFGGVYVVTNKLSVILSYHRDPKITS